MRLSSFIALAEKVDVLPRSQFFDRFIDTHYNLDPGDYGDRNNPTPFESKPHYIKRGIGTKWFAIAPVRLPSAHAREINTKLRAMKLNAIFDHGWNGSFHAWATDPHILSWGPTPARAKKSALAAARFLAENYEPRDEATERFKARQLVRPGD